ncbi:MAG TPA: GNAT family N-acetyltransferase [Gemmataceae bacterium]|jgi:GNAT superfamily N-acetyltransferase
MPDNWRIELLNDRHERGAFSCGKAPLDAFLRTQAGQYDRKGIGRTYVAVRPQSPIALGYYTLAASAVAFADLPKVIVKKLPKHPVPSILLGRLAVDNSVRGQGLGSTLLMDALHRALSIADQLGVFAVHVHAIDDDAKTFYAHFGFQSLIDQDRHMLLPIETIRKGFK